MLPTFRESGDLVIVDRFLRHLRKREYSKGDVVIAWAPYDPEKLVCKRIAGVAGDVVQREYFIGSRKIKSSVEVPPGHVWLLGDNPDNSKDSRNYGAGWGADLYFSYFVHSSQLIINFFFSFLSYFTSNIAIVPVQLISGQVLFKIWWPPQKLF
jgi:inner membrane protease subunit 1